MALDIDNRRVKDDILANKSMLSSSTLKVGDKVLCMEEVVPLVKHGMYVVIEVYQDVFVRILEHPNCFFEARRFMKILESN